LTLARAFELCRHVCDQLSTWLKLKPMAPRRRNQGLGR
jgi:hypothetical protein